MIRRPRFWLAVAALFTLLNAVSIGFAAAAGEALHTGVHVGLMFLGGYWMWRLIQRLRRQEISALQRQSDERLELLQNSLDAIALEVERIGEAQRFEARLAAREAEPVQRPEA